MVNHLPWSHARFRNRNVSTLQNHPSLAQLKQWGVDIVEVVNVDTFDLKGYQFAKQNGLGVATGSDMHQPSPPYAWTVASPANFTRQAIWTEIVNQRVGIMYDAEGLGQFMPDVSQGTYFEVEASWIVLSSFFKTFVTSQSGQWDSQGGFCHPPVVYAHPLSLFVYIIYSIGISAVMVVLVLLTRRYCRCKRKKRESEV
jgi:hypothetical protein